MSLKSCIEKASAGNATDEDADAYCLSGNIRPEDFCNQFALTVAKRYSDKTSSFDDCDCAMNFLFGYMISKLDNLADPAYSIYEAFDRGEYTMPADPAGIDPAEHHTRPMIEQILKEKNA